MKKILCVLAALVAVSASANEHLKGFIGEFEGTVQQLDLHASNPTWTATPVALSGRWIVAKHYAEVRGKFKFAGIPQAVELVFLWSWDPFQKEYRLVVLDDLVGLVDVFEQESTDPLTLSDFSHGTYFQDAHGRSYNRVTVDFVEGGAIRMQWAASRDGKSWSDFARLNVKPR